MTDIFLNLEKLSFHNLYAINPVTVSVTVRARVPDICNFNVNVYVYFLCTELNTRQIREVE